MLSFTCRALLTPPSTSEVRADISEGIEPSAPALLSRVFSPSTSEVRGPSEVAGAATAIAATTATGAAGTALDGANAWATEPHEEGAQTCPPEAGRANSEQAGGGASDTTRMLGTSALPRNGRQRRR